ncbi:MAG: cytochrome c [Deinococcales bacterium]|jgi:mono/diheme cytochrome c family protein
MRRTWVWVTVVVLGLVGAGLALGQAGRDGGAEAGGGSLGGAPAGLTGNAANGAMLYQANCQTCHGAKGQGGKYRGVGGEAARRGFGAFKRLILYGNERMPGYAKNGLSTSNALGKLGAKGYLGSHKAPTDQQIADLLAYIKTLPSRGGFGFGGDD